MMKLVFALLLCGFSASLATPTCDDSEANKCSEGSDVNKYPKTQEELNEFCRAILPELSCQQRFVDRCPNTLLGAFHVSMKLSRALYDKICEKDSSLGAMFLSKNACLEEEEDASKERCSEKVTVQDYCQRIDPVEKCINEELNRVCGEDGRELYAEMEKIQRAMKNVFCITE